MLRTPDAFLKEGTKVFRAAPVDKRLIRALIDTAQAKTMDELNMLDVKGRKLEALLGSTIREFEYQYDFGDSWQHRIVVESITEAKGDRPYPLCVAGERACPREDVGGIPGYQDFLEAIANPDHEEHESMLVWIGGAFDPEGFDIQQRQSRVAPPAALKSIRGFGVERNG